MMMWYDEVSDLDAIVLLALVNILIMCITLPIIYLVSLLFTGF